MEFLSSLRKDRCEQLRDPGYINFTLSIIILLGILVSYLPQHYRIVSRRTSEGISPYFILLGTTSSTSSIANILVLPASRADVQCCKVISSFECFSGLLGIAQVGTQWSCFTILLLLFFIFFPQGSSLPENTTAKQYTYRTAVTVATLCALHGLLVIIITSVVTISLPDYLSAWANTLGIMSASLAMVQYFPQIWTTYNLGHVGSLSLPMMAIQVPGSFLWSGSLFARLGFEGWSTWGVFLVTGCLQACLLIMGTAFELEARKKEHIAEGLRNSNGIMSGYGSEDEPPPNGNWYQNERTPLLRK